MTESSASFELQNWIAKARSGDTDARDKLFSACRSYVNLLARANVEPWMRAKQDASDLVQQTMLDAHRDFHQFAGANHQEWLAWLRQILNHNVQDAIRHYGTSAKRAARREIPLDVPSADESRVAFEPAANTDSPSQIIVHSEREILLAAAIDQLSEDYREVIVLRNIERLSFEDVAERMGRTRPATQMLWMRAVQKLKSILSCNASDLISGVLT